MFEKAGVLIVATSIDLANMFISMKKGWQAIVLVCVILASGFAAGVTFSNYIGIPDKVQSHARWVEKHDSTHREMENSMRGWFKILTRLDSIGEGPIIVLETRLDEIENTQDAVVCRVIESNTLEECSNRYLTRDKNDNNNGEK